nr:hypothetical protein FRC03_012944 [Tulasnella sp. 419]
MAHSTLQEILKSILFAAAVLSFGATYGQAANVHQHNGPSRRGLHQVQSQLKSNNDTGAELTKRLDNKGRATWYNVGMGACGKHNVDSDFIVALNSPQYGSGYPGPNCFKEITLSYNGKTAQAMIMDECPPCPSGGLDLSPDLFEYLANDLDWWGRQQRSALEDVCV